ncbi:hypothetical protein PAPYR_1686 [Paratrimastix pyriformis]|uniref:Transmembrane protein n=1 Tax=Paratrimastix pyriformis TaxID=342808 RepID=A0ABQ8US74_9EUKA|nr:hypothetical protein PAPYR_1686 [Paratrimastix pyriformis]
MPAARCVQKLPWSLIFSIFLLCVCIPLNMAGPGIMPTSGFFIFLPFLLQLSMHLQLHRLWFIFSIPCLTQVTGHFLAFINTLAPAFNWAILLIAAAMGLLYLVPYWVDVLIQRRFRGVFIRLVALPSVMTAASTFLTMVSPWGAWTDIGNTMNSVLEINRLGTLTGLGGLTFLVGLIASTANYVLDVLREDGRHLHFHLPPGLTNTAPPARPSTVPPAGAGHPYRALAFLFSLVFVALLACNASLMADHPGLKETLRAACLIDAGYRHILTHSDTYHRDTC